MLPADHERVLLVGDTHRQVRSALSQALPGAYVNSVPTYFDAIAELSTNTYTSVLAAIEPVERRPEAAVRTLRRLAGNGRLLLFGHPTLEPLSRKMLEFGCDDYLITPANPAELEQMFRAAPLRVAPAGEAEVPAPAEPPAQDVLWSLSNLPLADLLLDAMLHHPQEAAAHAVKQIGADLGPDVQLVYVPAGKPAPETPPGIVSLSHAVRVGAEDVATLHLLISESHDQTAARHTLAQLAHVIGKVESLQDRHKRLQKLAITDDLTGVANGRYFRYFLNTILERARAKHFLVTLLLFDIDEFKQYNDIYGHQVGDEILKQTAALMRRCCRDHDLVARIGGDEFAVVFWEKEGPRTPRDPKVAPSRAPQTPLQVLERFQHLLKSEQFRGLGPGGQGKLTISGGMAVFPFEAQDVEGLIAAADRRLVFEAKRSGKNTIVLVGSDQPTDPPEPDDVGL